MHTTQREQHSDARSCECGFYAVANEKGRPEAAFWLGYILVSDFFIFVVFFFIAVFDIPPFDMLSL
jgi:hypothetical protein